MSEQMVCSLCGKYGIRWVGPLSVPERLYTLCPHCGGKNCQEIELPADTNQEDDLSEMQP